MYMYIDESCCNARVRHSIRAQDATKLLQQISLPHDPVFRILVICFHSANGMTHVHVVETVAHIPIHLLLNSMF